MSRLAQRLAGVPPTVFNTMSVLAARTGAINLGQGFPDEDGPTSIIEVAERAMREGRNQYAPGRGVAELREAIARHQRRHYSIDLDPDTEVVVTAGATEAIAAAILGLVDPGDEVVVLEPFYDSYAAVIAMAGGVRRAVTLRAPDFRLDGEALRAAVTSRTKVLLINSPHNPTGTVLRRDELDLIAEVAIAHDLVVVTDEVYEHLTFGVEHIPLATLPGMAERTLTISSQGKTFSFTGWKVGWASGPADVVDHLLAAKQWLTYTNAAPLQPAVAHALDHEEGFVRDLRDSLHRKRDLACEALSAAGLHPFVPDGTYFVLTDISSLGWSDGLEFCLALPERAGVVAIPTQGFYGGADGDHLVRWAFCKQEATLRAGLERLGQADLVR